MKIFASAVAVLASFSAGAAGCGPTVGGTPVPQHLNCEEDEVIGFHGVPDDLACLHRDNLEVAE